MAINSLNLREGLDETPKPTLKADTDTDTNGRSHKLSSFVPHDLRKFDTDSSRTSCVIHQ